MLKNYLKTAWRNMWRNKVFSLINIAGLATGLACCMLILIYVQDQFSYDRHHNRVQDIYRVCTISISQEGEKPNVVSPAPLAAAFQSEFPEVEKAARMFVPYDDDKSLVQYFEGGRLRRSFYESRGYLVDADFFDIFSYHFIEGNARALQEPNTIVISQNMAEKLFGKASALDRVIRVNNSNGDINFKVTGVFTEQGKSHIDGRFFMSLKSGMFGEYASTWTNFAVNNIFYTYIKLRPGAYAQVLESKFPAFIEKYESEHLKASGFYKKHFLQPLTAIHLRSAGMEADFAKNGSITYIYVLILIAVFILVIACINFMNLSTARSSKRAVEVGIRKAVGAGNGSLIQQFIGESVLASFVALLLAVGLLFLILPLFNNLTDSQVTFAALKNPLYIAAFVVLALIAGLLAGSYPAFYLSAFRPVQVLKGKLKNSFSVVFIRKGLVVFQFAIAICLILGAIIILQQMEYMKQRDLGFKQSRQLIIPLRTATAKKMYQAYKSEIKNSPFVAEAAGCDSYPGTAVVADKTLYTAGKNRHEGIDVKSNWVDYDFAATLQLPLLAGRFFSKGFAQDTSGFNKIVLNEKAVKGLGYTPEEAIGKSVFFDWQGRQYTYEIIGVTKDFHFEGLKEPIKSYGFEMQQGTYNHLLVQLNSDHMQSALQSLAATWKKLNSNEPFEYYFLDQQFQRNYEMEQRTGSLITVFTIIAIFISCMGLYGLTLFTAEQKVKEIGIRKVLGASVSHVVALLSKEFLLLVMVAALVAAPVAWWGMSQWLQHFAYHTSIQWWVFVAAAVLALLIALFTISFQAIKAAIANPIKSLRTE